MRAASVSTFLAFFLCIGCDPGVEPTGEDTDGETDADAGGQTATPGTVLLLVDVNPEPACSDPDVTQVQIVARRIGCESPPPAPCTVPVNPPAIEGDVFTCPNTDPSRLLGVEVTQAGRYVVETLATVTAAEPDVTCYGLDGAAEIVVPADDVEAGATIMLDAAAVGCP